MNRPHVTKNALTNRINAVRGKIAPDLVLKGGRVINVFTHEIIEADAAIEGSVIVGIGSYEGKSSIDARRDYISPGFIDGHFTRRVPCSRPRSLRKLSFPAAQPLCRRPA